MLTSTLMSFPTEKTNRSLLVNLNAPFNHEDSAVVTFVETGSRHVLYGMVESELFLNSLGVLLTMGEFSMEIGSDKGPVIVKMIIDFKTCELKCEVDGHSFWLPFTSNDRMQEMLSSVYMSVVTTTTHVEERPVPIPTMTHVELINFTVNNLSIEFITLSASGKAAVRFLDKAHNNVLGVITPEMFIWFLIRYINKKKVRYDFPFISQEVRAFSAGMKYVNGWLEFITGDVTYKLRFETEEAAVERMRDLNRQLLQFNWKGKH